MRKVKRKVKPEVKPKAKAIRKVKVVKAKVVEAPVADAAQASQVLELVGQIKEIELYLEIGRKWNIHRISGAENILARLQKDLKELE